MATTIATSTFAQPIVRAGSRCIIKLGNGNLLVVYHDGAVGLKSKEASSEANLASATAVAIVATTDTGDPKSYCLFPDGNLITMVASNATANSYQTYATGAWTARTQPGTMGNFNEASGFKSGSNFYFTSWGNFTAEFDAHYVTSFGGTWTSLGQNNVANTAGVDNQGLVALPWKSLILNLMLDSGKNLQWYAKDTLAGVSGGNFQAATSLETLGATPPYQNNLAGVTDSNGNAWMAYNDGTGMVLRMITASGTSWTAKTSVTAQSSDAYPALFQDTNGNVWVFWVDGGAGNAIKGQKATVSAGAISLSGSVQTISSGSATRTFLNVIESDASNAYLSWVEGTGSPYNIVFHTYSIASGAAITWTPAADSQTTTDSAAWSARETRADTQTLGETGAWAGIQTLADAQTLGESLTWAAAHTVSDAQAHLDGGIWAGTLAGNDSETPTDSVASAEAWTATADTQTPTDSAAAAEAWTATSDTQTLVESSAWTATASFADSETPVDGTAIAASWTPVADHQTTTDTWTATLVGGSLAWTTATDSQTATDSTAWAATLTIADVPLAPTDVGTTQIAPWLATADHQTTSDSLVATLVGGAIGWTPATDTQTPADSAAWSATPALADAQAPTDGPAATAAVWSVLADAQAVVDAAVAAQSWNPAADTQTITPDVWTAVAVVVLSDSQAPLDTSVQVLVWLPLPADQQTSTDATTSTPLSGLATVQQRTLTVKTIDGSIAIKTADGSLAVKTIDGSVILTT